MNNLSIVSDFHPESKIVINYSNTYIEFIC